MSPFVDDYGNLLMDTEEQMEAVERLKRVINDVLDSRNSVDAVTHAKHHQLIDLYLERKQKYDAIKQKFYQSFVGAIAVAVVGGALSAFAFIGKLVIEYVKQNPPSP